MGRLCCKTILSVRRRNFELKNHLAAQDLIQEAGPFNSICVLGRGPPTFATQSVISGHTDKSAPCPLYPQ